MTLFDTFPEDGVAVVFGASGGIGRALHDQLATSERFIRSLGFSRRIEPRFDLTDESSVKNAMETAAAIGPIRLVINATGFLHDDSQGPEKSLREIETGKLARSFALNAIGPALIMKHAAMHLPTQGKCVIALLSARVGSIGDNQLGGWYGYRSSKAALNQLLRTAAIEIHRRRKAAICVALHPGTVRTKLSSPFSKEGLDVQTPEQAAIKLLGVIDSLREEQTGSFLDYNGKPVPW